MLSGRRTDPAKWRLAARLRRQGRTLAEIGRRLGVSHQAVGQLLRKYGLGQPTFSVPQVLAWADAFHARTGRWPKKGSGRIIGTLSDSWRTVDNALRYGLRGLPGGSSLAQLLAEHRGVRNVRDLPELTEQEILAWADGYRLRTGHWPNEHSGPVPEAPGEVWRNVDMALREGHRGLPGSSTLARLLAAARGVRNRASIPPLSVEQILAWADAHRERTGRWPNREAGPVVGVPGETWAAVDAALRQGCRGLSAGGSLARLLAEHRGVRNRGRLPRLTPVQIRAWAEAHYRRTGRWPTAESGPIPEAPGETWKAVQMALAQGLRGLPGRWSLSRFLKHLAEDLESA